MLCGNSAPAAPPRLNRPPLSHHALAHRRNSAAADGIITGILNPAAAAIMTPLGIPQVDLHKPIIEKCGPVPQASCFGQVGCWSPHCPPGYAWLADNYISPVIRAALATP